MRIQASPPDIVGTGTSMRLAVGEQRKPRTSGESGGNQMPRIVQFHRLGGPEVLEIEDVPSSGPSSGEVTLRVQAIGLNRAESMFMHGYYLEPPRLPARLGYEASGTVTAIGPDVDPRWLCKNVSTIPAFSPNRYGVLGTEVIVPVHAVAEYPSHLTAIEATSIWMQYMMAYGALVELSRLRKGEFALITAASSSVGVAAIQTVKAEGAVSVRAGAGQPPRTQLSLHTRTSQEVSNEHDHSEGETASRRYSGADRGTQGGLQYCCLDIRRGIFHRQFSTFNLSRKMWLTGARRLELLPSFTRVRVT